MVRLGAISLTQSISSEVRDHAAWTGSKSVSTGLSGMVRASPGWKSYCSIRNPVLGACGCLDGSRHSAQGVTADTTHAVLDTNATRALFVRPRLAAETPTPPTYTSTLLNLTITHSISTACMHGVVRGCLVATGALSLDVRGDGGQVAGRADDHPDRHLHVEDVVQKIRKGQRRQRVSAEIGERRIGGHINRGGTEQRTRGTATVSRTGRSAPSCRGQSHRSRGAARTRRRCVRPGHTGVINTAMSVMPRQPTRCNSQTHASGHRVDGY